MSFGDSEAAGVEVEGAGRAGAGEGRGGPGGDRKAVTTAAQTQADLASFASSHTQTEGGTEAGVQADPEGAARDAAAEARGAGDEEVLAFLALAAPLMEAEVEASRRSTAFDRFGVSRGPPAEGALRLHATLASSAALGFAAVSWNCNGTAVAGAAGVSTHVGWCAHRSELCVWPLSSAKEQQLRMETPCCVTAVSFHPALPTVVAAGLFNGEVRVWDTAREDDPLLAATPVDDLYHREPVTRVEWVTDRGGGGGGDTHALASVSGDGRVLFWSLGNGLVYPAAGCSLAPTGRYHGHGRVQNRYPVLGGTALCFSVDKSSYVVGTEGGGLLRCLRPGKAAAVAAAAAACGGEFKWAPDALALVQASAAAHRPAVRRHVEKHARLEGAALVTVDVVFGARPPPHHLFPNASTFAFSPHSGPVSALAASPFHRNLFLSCSTDSSVRLYHMHRREPLLSLEPAPEYLHAAAWSRSRPLVFAVAGASGAVRVYDLLASVRSPAATVGGGGDRDAVTGLDFSPGDAGLLAVSHASGAVRVYRLPPFLCAQQEGEHRACERLGAVAST